MNFTISKPEFSAVSTGKLSKVVEITSKTKENAVTRATALLWTSAKCDVHGRKEWVNLPVPTTIVASGQIAEILLELAKCNSATITAMGFVVPLTGTDDGKIEVGKYGFEATRQELVVQKIHIRSFKPVEGEGEQSVEEALKDAASQPKAPAEVPTTEASAEESTAETPAEAEQAPA